MPKKKPKVPTEMTTDEAIRHLFHPEVVEHAKREARKAEKSQVRTTKPKSKD